MFAAFFAPFFARVDCGVEALGPPIAAGTNTGCYTVQGGVGVVIIMQQEQPVQDLVHPAFNIMDSTDKQQPKAIRGSIQRRQTRMNAHPLHRHKIKRNMAAGEELDQGMEGALMKMRAQREKRERAVTLLQVKS